MTLVTEIQAAKMDPNKLERLYQSAQKEGQAEVFQSALLACYEDDPGNLLYAAWFYRFQQTVEAAGEPRRVVNWVLAIPLSILTGLIFWALSDFESLMYLDHLPVLALWWSPIATMTALIFMTITAKNNQVRAVALGLGLIAVTVYAMLVAPGLGVPWKTNYYLDLAAIHIPLLCWIALGISVLGFNSKVEDRFAFLIKSIEVMITAGLYLIAGLALGGITIGMFEALSISIPEIWLRLIAAGGFGLLPVLAVASVYDPTVPPSEQDFDQGLSKFIATMMRLLLPLTLGVLVIYIIVIPFYFFEPFNNRDVLIVYNLMLFAIMALLLGATPIRGADLSPQLQKWLRGGIISVAVLAGLVSIYALSATSFRTIEGGWTINRITIIGWNIINICILFWLVFKQFKAGRERWIDSLHSVFSLATNAYLVWGLFVVLVIPWLFR
ncbi:MAG: hypothetical protein AB8I56_09065 [Anaerolineales bacterium]|jgi:hypothetical protein